MAFEELKARLDAATPNSIMQEFRELLVATMDALNLQPVDVCRKMGASIPTVLRWKEGVSAPHPAMRPPTLAALKELIVERETKPV
jgi:hypothetical protein